MKLTALKPLERPPVDGDKVVQVPVGATFEVADPGEAKALVRGGLAKPADEAKPSSAPAAAPAAAGKA